MSGAVWPSPMEKFVEAAKGLDCGTFSMKFDQSADGWIIYVNSCRWLNGFRFPDDPFEDATAFLDETLRLAWKEYQEWEPTYRVGSVRDHPE